MTVPLTVVIPWVDDHADLLSRALASVHLQTAPAAAVITIHDRERKRAAWARNEGLRKVQTEYVSFLDADDELHPSYAAAMVAAAVKTQADLVYPCTEFVGPWERGDPTAVSVNGVWVPPCGVPFGPEQDRHLRYAGNFIPIGWLARTDLLRDVGGFPPAGQTVGTEEDYLLLLKLRKRGAQFHHLPQRLYRYWKHDRNTGGGWEGTGGSNTAAFT